MILSGVTGTLIEQTCVAASILSSIAMSTLTVHTNSLLAPRNTAAAAAVIIIM